MKTLLCPMGLGDAILLSGAVVTLAQRYGGIRIPSFDHNLPSVASFYINHPEVTICEMPVTASYREFAGQLLFIVFVPSEEEFRNRGILQQNSDALRCGFYASDKAPMDISFPEWFYRQLDVPYPQRWDSCPIPPAVDECEQYDVWKDWEGPRVLIHEDNARHFHLPVDKPCFRLPYNRGPILHFAKAMKEADELHFFDSGPYHFADSLDLRGDCFYYPNIKPPSPFFSCRFPRKNKWSVIE